MICTNCGRTVPDDALTCEGCGTYLGGRRSRVQESGVRAMRQGRMSAAPGRSLDPRSDEVKEYGDYELSSMPAYTRPGTRPSPVQPQYAPHPTLGNARGSMSQAMRASVRAGSQGSSRADTRRGVPVNTNARITSVHKSRQMRTHTVRRHSINWMAIGLVVFILALAGGTALYFTHRNSESGQRSIARKNVLSVTEGMFALAADTKDPLVQEERTALLKQWSDASPEAYRLNGQDYLDIGDVETAITCFRVADVIDPENYDGLILLANAYELNAQDDLAEAIYLRLTDDVSPFRTEAYTALIRMYQDQERRPEAADMMLKAYRNTDSENFRLMRKDYIPETPQTNLEAGRYEISKLSGDVYLTSPQGYDIYYTTDDNAVLPQQGTLSPDGCFEPTEGTVKLRAVCVSGDLVSDPLSVTYTFFYPTPPAPKCNLAPNTYKTLREISLRPGVLPNAEEISKREQEEIASHYVYYYTIDGSQPTEESPVYDGTPIKMPAGRVTLKAVCVNQYGKMSTTLEVGYKFNVTPWPPEMYGEEDVFAGFALNKTTYEEFVGRFGQGKSTTETTYLNLEGTARHLEYDWGHAVFALDKGEWRLIRIDMHRQLTTGPRGVGFGSTESEIAAAYKDFGQVQSPNGTRGLYYEYPSVGQVLIADNGARYVQYSCETLAADMWILRYHLGSDGRVNRIEHFYQP